MLRLRGEIPKMTSSLGDVAGFQCMALCVVIPRACIAPILASITAFRTIVVQRTSTDKKRKAAAAAVVGPSTTLVGFVLFECTICEKSFAHDEKMKIIERRPGRRRCILEKGPLGRGKKALPQVTSAR